MKKREIIILCILIAAAFLINGISQVNAEGYDKYNIYINNNKLDKSIAVQEFNGFDYIPINQMQADLSITVKEDKTAKTVVITTREKTVKIKDSVNVEINNSPSSKLDAPLISKENNIYLPIIAAFDIFGWQVEVMDDVRCIRIKTLPNAKPVGMVLEDELSIQNGKTSSPYKKVAYLTFDDGLDAKITPMILDILKQNEIKATFFILGKTVEKNKDLLQRMVDEGHSIGNHTYSHEKSKIYSSAEGLRLEIDKTNEVIFNAVGIVPRLFRPPYGGTYIRNDKFKQVLSPYKTVLWNVDSMDSKSISIKSEYIISSVIEQVKNKRSAIIIMHDSGTHIETAKSLPAIIKYLLDNEFTLLPIYESTNLYYEY